MNKARFCRASGPVEQHCDPGPAGPGGGPVLKGGLGKHFAEPAGRRARGGRSHNTVGEDSAARLRAAAARVAKLRV